MAEEPAFVRRASGLVRGLSMTDAFAVGFMNQEITPSIGLIFTTGLGLFFGDSEPQQHPTAPVAGRER